MPVLNESVQWDDLSKDVGPFFKGRPKKVYLPEGFQLYKATGFDLKDPKTKNITEWWAPLNAYELDPGLESRRSIATRLNVPFGDLVRGTYAVRENWNSLTHLLTAVLQEWVYGFYGQCSAQCRLTPGKAVLEGVIKGTTSNLPGYGWQFYIPYLGDGHIRKLDRIQL